MGWLFDINSEHYWILLGEMVAMLVGVLVFVHYWRRLGFGKVKPFLAPMLISIILVFGDVKYRILESHWLTALAIVSAILLEIVLSLIATGRFPHLASAYITGISVGIIVHAQTWEPFVLCSLLSISSKYALRVGVRALWNPSNLGISVMLFLIPAAFSPLSDEFGNEPYPVLIIMAFGSLILYTLGRLHITATYVIAYLILSYVRTLITGQLYTVEIALLTSPSYMLFMFFMITDPKTTTLTRFRQCVVAVIVAIVETILRLTRDVHAPYYALFIVAPITNLMEIAWIAYSARSTIPKSPPVNNSSELDTAIQEGLAIQNRAREDQIQRLKID